MEMAIAICSVDGNALATEWRKVAAAGVVQAHRLVDIARGRPSLAVAAEALSQTLPDRQQALELAASSCVDAETYTEMDTLVSKLLFDGGSMTNDDVQLTALMYRAKPSATGTIVSISRY